MDSRSDQKNALVRDLDGEDLSHARLFFAAILAIALGIFTFQYLIVRAVIPVDFSISYIILNTTQPNFSSAFLNNYAHNPFDTAHLMSNVPFFVIVSAMIYGMAWYLQNQGFQLPSKFLLINYAVMLLLLPFSISGISIWTSRIFDKGWSLGLSGINFALLGLFLTLFFSFTVFVTFRKHSSRVAGNTFVILVSFALFVAVVSALIFYELKSPAVGVYAHFGGFLLGLVVPSLVGAYLTSERKNQKILTVFILCSSITIPALFWIFL